MPLIFRDGHWFAEGAHQHRDGQLLHDVVTVSTNAAIKSNGRGTTINHTVIVGLSQIKARESRHRGSHLVVGILHDVHHMVLNRAQARALGELLMGYAETGEWPPTPAGLGARRARPGPAVGSR